jgi:tetratricopeptide (TPR) repeat protein
MEDLTVREEISLSRVEETMNTLKVPERVEIEIAEICDTEICDIPPVIETDVEPSIEPTHDFQPLKDDQAVHLFQSAIKTWVDAWIAEDNSLPREAKEKFQQARDQFSEALHLDRENLEYQTFVTISSLKIDGNEAFNEAVKLQEKANATCMKYLFQEARNKFQDASGKFDQAYQLTKNEKFADCCKFIEDNVSSINTAIRKIQLNTGVMDDRYFRM